MKKIFAFIASMSLSITALTQEVSDSVSGSFPGVLSFPEALTSIPDSIDIDDGVDFSLEDISDNPLFFKLFMPLVLYGSAVSDAIAPQIQDNAEQDSLLPLESFDDAHERTLAKMIDETLVRIYLEHPELVKMTEEELMDVPGVIPISDAMISGIRLKDPKAGNQVPSGDKRPEGVRFKQRFWKTFGNFQGKYTQSHYSDNWYKGGESNHSILGQINLEADYAKKNTTLDNKLELKLGYYTTEVNGKNTFRTNDDLIRFTSKFGLRAMGSWNYSAQFQGYTQFMPVFDTKVTTKLKSKFFAPAYGNLSLGMDYKPKFKNKNITLSLIHI